MTLAARPNAARTLAATRAAAARSNATRRRWTLLGRVETAAPAAALLRALRELRPQWNLRVRREAAASAIARYRIEIAADEPLLPPDATVSPWLRVKSALIAAFPADKPNALRALD